MSDDIYRLYLYLREAQQRLRLSRALSPDEDLTTQIDGLLTDLGCVFLNPFWFECARSAFVPALGFGEAI